MKLRMFHFLAVLFEKTKRVIDDLKGAKTRFDCITQFWDFMKEGQDAYNVGEKRKNFYGDIAVETVSHIHQLNFMFLHFTEDSE